MNDEHATRAPQPSVTGQLVAAAAADALAAVAAARDRMLIVASAANPVAERVVAASPEQVLRAPGSAAKLVIGAGARSQGLQVVVVLDHGAADLHEVAEAGLVVVSTDPAHLTAARDAGLLVVQPAWPQDVAPLLDQVLDSGEPAFLRLHPAQTQRLGAPPDSPSLGVHRILGDGHAGLLVASGAGVAPLREVLPLLAGRGLDVTAVEAHTLRPGTGLDPAATAVSILVGRYGLADARELRPVAFEGPPRELFARILGALPVPRPVS